MGVNKRQEIRKCHIACVSKSWIVRTVYTYTYTYIVQVFIYKCVEKGASHMNRKLWNTNFQNTKILYHIYLLSWGSNVWLVGAREWNGKHTHIFLRRFYLYNIIIYKLEQIFRVRFIHLGIYLYANEKSKYIHYMYMYVINLCDIYEFLYEGVKIFIIHFIVLQIIRITYIRLLNKYI